MSADALTIQFPYVPEQHAEALHQTKRWGWKFRLIKASGVIFAALGVVVIGVGLVAGESAGPLLQSTLPVFGLGAFWRWVVPRVLRWLQVRQLSKDATDSGRVRETVVLGSDGFTPGPRWQHPIPWERIELVQESSDLLIISAVDGETYFLPKAAVSSEELVRLRDLFGRVLSNDATRLRLLPRAT